MGDCMPSCEVTAKELLEYLLNDKSFDIDDVTWDDSKITVPDDLMSSWKTEVDPVTIEELTSRKAFGSGVFDAIMEAVHNHLKVEYDASRITGAEYATTYCRLTEAAMANAVQFCLQKNQAYYQGVLAQAQAVTAGIQAQIAAITAKVQLAKTKAEALGVGAQYALTTMKLATECNDSKIREEQLRQAEYQTRFLNPEPTGSDAENNVNVDFLLKEAQVEHVKNQMEVEDKQKELYETQSTAYERKWEHDIASLFANQYTAMKSVDEGLALPKAFSGASINEVLQKAKAKVNLGDDNTSLSGDALTAYLQNGILKGATADENSDDDD